MLEQPHLTHGLERARLLLAQNRLAELTFDDLTPAERSVVLDHLERKMTRARRRALRSHALGVLSLGAFIALGALVFGVGPLTHISAAGQVEMTDATLEAQIWVVAVGLTALGAASADYVLRRRRKLTAIRDRELDSIADTIARARTPRGS